MIDYKELKHEIKRIEAEILEITGDVYARHILSDYVEALLKSRCDLLNRMFCPTVENIARFHTVNNYLRNLTRQAYKRLAEINSVEYYTASPDDDNEEVESWVRFVFNDEDSVLKREDDDYYGSNFTLMIKALAELYQLKGQERIIYTRDGINRLDDGKSWVDAPFDKWEAAFKNTVICYAIHDLTAHKAYSIPDLFRLNDFWTEARITFQSRTRQSYSGLR